MLDNILNYCDVAPEQVFYQSKEIQLKYQELKDFIIRVRSQLQSIDGVIVLIGHKEIELIMMIFACLASHKCYIVLENDIPQNRIDQMLSKFSVGCIVNCGNDEMIQGIRIEELLALPVSNHQYEDELAYLAFTSGTSGEPKGIRISRGNLNNFLDWCFQLSPLQQVSYQTIMNFVSFSFDLSLADIIFGFFSHSTIIADEMNYLTQGNIHHVQPTMLVLTPTMSKVLMLDRQFNEEHLPNLKTIFFAGEILEKKTVLKLKERFPSCSIINAYGPTEACCVVSGLVITDEHMKYETVPIGDMKTNAVEITLTDENEIILSGKSVFPGYLGETETRKNYATGDLGSIKDGLLFFEKRKDRQIKWKGYRIDPQEIEERLLKMPQVETAIIQTIKDQAIVKAFDAVVSISSDIDEMQIKEYLRMYLPDYMIPRRIRIQSGIQMNDRGKKA